MAIGPASAALLLLVSAAAQSAETPERFEGTVTAETPQAHALILGPRRFVRLLLTRDRADVALTVRGPGGEAIVAADTLVFPPGPRPLAFVTESDGEHALEVSLLPAGQSSGYSVTVVEHRAAGPADELRAAAERDFFEGERLRLTGTADSLAEARRRCEDALAAARRLAAPELEADSLSALGRVHEALSQRKEALQAFDAALAIHRRLRRGSAVANVLNYAAQADDQLGARERARERLEAALAEGRASGDRRVVGLTLNNMANLDWGRGEYRRAIETWELSLAEHRAAGNPRGEAQAVNGIGVIYDATGEKARALEYLRRALELRRAVGDPRETAGVLNNIGTVHFALDEIEPALAAYEEALAGWRAAGDRSGEGATLHNIARVHEATGQYQQSLASWRESLRLLRATQSTVRVANVLTRLGGLYATLGDQRQALAAYEEALQTHRATGNRPFVATTLSNLGTILAALGDRARSLEHQEQALALFRSIEDPSGEATALAEIARVRASTGDVAAARAGLGQSLELWRKLRNRRGQAAALVQLVELDATAGAFESAVSSGAAALALYRDVGDRTGEASALHSLARAQRDRGELGEARRQAMAGLAVVEGLRAGIGSQELRAAFLATAQDHYALLIDVLARLHRKEPAAGHEREALGVSERARARSLLDLLGEARAGIREGVDPALLMRERRLAATMSAKAARLQQLLLAKSPDEAGAARLGREIDALGAEWQVLEAEIRAASPRYAALAHPSPLGAAEIQAALDPGTLLLQYAFGRERSFLFAVTGESVELHELPARAQIETAARAFLGSARDPQLAAVADGAALGRMLLGPAARALARARRVAVVGDGALLSLPFAALVPDRELVALPSASTLAVLRRETRQRAAAPRTLAVLADPVFAAQDPRVQRAPETAPASGESRAPARLLGSRREARAILELVPPAEARAAFDFEASRALATSAELGRFRIVHLATHGVLDDDRPALSGVVLSLVDEQGRAQDGLLRLQDVYNLRWPVELVVLSACESGLGKEVRGEGLLGLARGFMYAGAPRVVTTLWKVDDRATAELMSRFYRGMLGPRRLAPAAALRAAQSSMREEPRWRAPYYWAGFVLQGEWR
jgi:CHAT domain-containing protein/tetratricopeptide (TPR) repeat protein